ncbi:metal transport protein [Trifolium medium]|uniref:Metal transport protein n=1 Tax=Trifolium medium TaxID=97028 RepID=A0A392PPD5_9FABA|nr:metal transport protein [Trifolium medium]
MGTLMVETYATAYFQNQYSKKASTQGESHVAISDVEKEAVEHHGHVHVHTHASHGHAHGHVSSDPSGKDPSLELLRHRVISEAWDLEVV